MRSIHSIIDRTDQQHMKEIILVDDYSDIDDLHEQVQKAISELNNSVKKQEEMLETNNIDGENMIPDYINDDTNDSLDTLKKTADFSTSSFNIRLLKTKKREGLIRARLYGAQNSVGEVSKLLIALSIISFVTCNGFS